MTVSPLTDGERRCKRQGAADMQQMIAQWLIDNANGRRSDFFINTDASCASLRAAAECILRGNGPPVPAYTEE